MIIYHDHISHYAQFTRNKKSNEIFIQLVVLWGDLISFHAFDILIRQMGVAFPSNRKPCARL